MNKSLSIVRPMTRRRRRIADRRARAGACRNTAVASRAGGAPRRGAGTGTAIWGAMIRAGTGTATSPAFMSTTLTGGAAGDGHTRFTTGGSAGGGSRVTPGTSTRRRSIRTRIRTSLRSPSPLPPLRRQRRPPCRGAGTTARPRRATTRTCRPARADGRRCLCRRRIWRRPPQ